MNNPFANVSRKTGATFHIPRWRNRNQIKALDKSLRRKCPKSYRGLKGRIMVFEFESQEERDDFLTELATMINQQGNKTENIQTTV